MDCISHMDVKSLWGNSNFDFVASDSLGNSGGILCIWEASIFKKDGATISDNFIAIYGTWLPRNVKILLVAVYAPQQPGSKRALWDFLSNLVRRWNGEAIIMGDFNDVRTMDERLGSSFNVSSARCFDRFIVSSGLVDVKLEGYSFTWSHPSASKMSKLDRFLVTEGIISLYPSISALCLDRHLSDHRPILLREVLSDFGPTPFRFYQSWLRMEGFDSMVEHAWLSFSHSDSNAMVRFKKKLQDLKSIIRLWVKDKKFHLHNAKNSLQNDLISIDKDLERGNVSDDILLNRMDLNRRLQDIKLLEVKDLVQKSKIKWAIEGDENSKFFHGIINKKRSQLSIRGVFVEGTWCTDPSIVKEAFKNHFEVRFQQPCHDRLKLNAPFHNRLSNGSGVRWIVQYRGTKLRRIGMGVCSETLCYLVEWTVGECMSRKSALCRLGEQTPSPVPKGVLKTMESIRSKFFNGVDSSDRKISWVAWDNVLASKLNGGLGVSSFFALNRALLLKWVWRFISGDGSLWCKVIQAIYGSKFDLHVTDQPSIWCSILREVKSLKDSGFDFSSHSDAHSLCFSSSPFVCFDWIRRCGAIIMGAFGFSFFSGEVRDGADRQQWDDRSSIIGVATRWVKFCHSPFKVNVFSWRARRDRLPTRVNLSRRGVLLDSICVLFVMLLWRMFSMFSFDVTWLGLFFVKFVVGGIWIGRRFVLSRIGMLGSYPFVFLPVSKF
ncbi:RNA-directed DNA polymerase, eukaryota [Tanacetum coccineum]